MDVTRRRYTVEAMHLCDKALASTTEAITITDPNLPDNPIIYCNQGFEALTGAGFAKALALRGTGTGCVAHLRPTCQDPF